MRFSKDFYILASHREAELWTVKHPAQPGEDGVEKGHQCQKGNDVGNNTGHDTHSTRRSSGCRFQNIAALSEDTRDALITV